jgi:putative hydrolase of HD superfamily
MDHNALEGILTFIKKAENLKNTLRYSFTSNGSQESSAEHSWRLSLLVMLCASYFPNLNIEKALKMAIIHDLSEAICGDTPAIYQVKYEVKINKERKALANIVQSLTTELQNEIIELWEEYERAETEEAHYVKSLDKLETLIQHNQGINPVEFNYEFNITYGNELVGKNEFLTKLKQMIDIDTKSHTR